MLTYIVTFFLLYTTQSVSGICDTAPSISNAFHNSSVPGPYPEGHVLRYLCGQAYDRSLGGSNYYQCSNGDWTGGNITCTLGYCPAVDTPENSEVVGQTGHYVLETTTYRCKDGYEMTGESVIECRSDRTWHPAPPSCSKIKCPEFGTENAEIFQDSNGGARNEFESTNKVTCITGSGTVREGPQYITCQANKTWSGSPRCITPDCGKPPAAYEPCTDVYYQDGNTQAGSTVEITCKENALVSGSNNFLTCGQDKRWSSDYHCLCGCSNITISGGPAVYSGPHSVQHGVTIQWSCKYRTPGIKESKCVNGTLTLKSSCPLPRNCYNVKIPENAEYDGSRSVKHADTVYYSCKDGKNSTESRCTDGTMTPELFCLAPPPCCYVIIVIVVVVCAILFTSAIVFFFCPCCKECREKLHKFCCKSKHNDSKLRPDKNDPPPSLPLLESAHKQ